MDNRSSTSKSARAAGQPSAFEAPYGRCEYGDLPPVDKNVPFRTFMHYTDPDAGKKDVTVFGSKQKGLFYNYSDRLFGEKWLEGERQANASEHAPNTAHWFEVVLKHFHGAEHVDLQHVMLGCNRSTGYHYLVFGYTYQLHDGADEES